MTTSDTSTSSTPWLRKRSVVLTVIILFFIIYTGIILAPRTTDMYGKIHDGPDPRILLWALTWSQKAIIEDPFHFYRANVYYPHDAAFAYSDTLLVPALMSLPFRLITDEPTVIFNITYWMTFAMSGVFMYLLVLHLTRNHFISWLIGMFYAFSPFRLDNITHIQYSQHQFLPLMILFALLFFKKKKLIYGLLLAAATWLTALSNAAYLIMGVLPFGILIGLLLIARKLNWKQFGVLVVCGAIAVIAVGIFFYTTFALVISQDRVSLSHDNRAVFAPDVYDLLKQPKYHTSTLHQMLPEKIRTPYFSLFPGFMAGIAILFSLFFMTSRTILRRKKQPDDPQERINSWYRWSNYAVLAIGCITIIAIVYVTLLPPQDDVKEVNFVTIVFALVFMIMLTNAVLAAIARRVGIISTSDFLLTAFTFLAISSWMLALGPYVFVNNHAVGANIFIFFNALLPGLSVVRVVVLFNTFFMLFILPVAAIVLSRVSEGISRKVYWSIAAAVILILFYENQTDMSRDFVEVPTEVPETYQFLAEQAPRSPIMELPMWDHPHHPEADRHYWSMYHWNPMVNGFWSYFPPDYYQTLDYVKSFPSQKSIQYIQDQYQLRYLVVRTIHYNEKARERMLELFEQEWSHYKLVKQFPYFWLFENTTWKDADYYNSKPPEILGPIRSRY